MTSFPSKFLKASDLNGEPVIATVAGCEMEEVGNDEKAEQKPVLRFKGQAKGLVLNKTNATALAGFFGQETSGWVGKKVTLMPTTTQYGGKSVDCIRVAKAAQEGAKPTTFDTDEEE